MIYYPKNIEYAVNRECNRRRLSPRTTKTYLFCIQRFLRSVGKPLQHISKKDVRLFLEDQAERKLSGSSLNTYHMAIRFLFTQILDKKMWIDIKYSKIPERLQRVLNKEEIGNLIANVSNHKHKIMIALMYSAGLRVSELINLRVEDLKIKDRYGYIRNGKGRKDRIFVISERLKAIIQQIITNDELIAEDYLFKSNRNKKYSMRSVQQIIKKAARNACLDYKNIHPHTLRHSFATHLIENNYTLTDIQTSLGHKSPETSMIYTHSSGKMLNIKSPFDTL